ncbi:MULTISPECIES: YtxH domain-containing protein [Streptomyces]|uniref:YtxH domain-containing protein n=1 Tax=Streptomyces spirodelae TaxID=2812904 RepID=A0ABS3WMW8_9ACTN|nr:MULTISPECIES: YtxH domain-containing protein [Streptomyces]MBO8184452.1 YtxH domain-containing protein [Streptomyces spirodelae]UNZ19453.1 YtxH domain-containing protein [Streptomyces sp. 891-h]
MRYRLTFVSGLAVGYVLGARAGRERYEQIMKGVRRIAENPAVRNAGEAAALSGRQAATKAADAVQDRLPSPVSDRVRTVRDHRARAGSDWGAEAH